MVDQHDSANPWDGQGSRDVQELSLVEAAQFLNVSLKFVSEQADAGRLPCRSVAGQPLVSLDALHAYRHVLLRGTEDALKALADQGQELGI